jgi:hypothetical protein
MTTNAGLRVLQNEEDVWSLLAYLYYTTNKQASGAGEKNIKNEPLEKYYIFHMMHFIPNMDLLIIITEKAQKTIVIQINFENATACAFYFPPDRLILRIESKHPRYLQAQGVLTINSDE